MGASAAILFPFLGEAGAGAAAADVAGAAALDAGTAAAAGSFLDPALVAASMAPLPGVVGDIAAGTFEFAPAAAEAAGAAASGLGALTGTSADYAAGLAPGVLTDAGLGSSVGTSAAAQGLTGTAAQYAGGLAGASPSALTPALSSGLGSAASSAIPTFAQGSVLPLTEQAVEGEVLSPLASQAAQTPLLDQAAQAGSEFTASPLPTGGPEAVGSISSTAAQPTQIASLTPGINVNPAPVDIGAAPMQVAEGVTPAAPAAVTPEAGAAITPTATTPAVGSNAVGGSFYPGSQGSALAPTSAVSPLTPVVETPAAAAPAAAAPAAAAPAAAPAAGAAASTTADAASAAGGEGFNLGKLAKDYGSLALGGAGLAYNMLKGNEPVPYSAQLESQAAQLQAQGAQLQGYLSSGTLPPGIGAALQGAHDSAAASIRAQYASRGMSGSSAEMQDLANLAQTTVSQGANIASSLLSTGVSEQEFASGLYQNLMAQSVAQDTAMSNAIAGFTNAMAGGYAKKAAPVG